MGIFALNTANIELCLSGIRFGTLYALKYGASKRPLADFGSLKPIDHWTKASNETMHDCGFVGAFLFTSFKEPQMSLSGEQIDLVQSSFSKVKPISDQAAELFYARLFEIAPQVKPMFKGDMVEQGRKLMAMIHTVVNGLKNLDDIVPAAQNLARSHVNYGVQSEHYTYVGEALIYALEQGLAEDFTQPVKQAWIEAYTLLSDVMIAAAEQFEMANKKPLWKRLLKG